MVLGIVSGHASPKTHSFDTCRDVTPDMDLLDENGNLCVRCDGVKDSLSIGVGFTAVTAVIQ